MATSRMCCICLTMTMIFLGSLASGQAVLANPHSANVPGAEPIQSTIHQLMSDSIKQAMSDQRRQDEADKAFYHWFDNQPISYQFELTINCWCDFSGQYVFEVVDGEPVIDSANPAWLHNQWGVMEGVFDRIQEAMDWQYQTIDVDYHQEHFYPTRIHFFDHQFDQLTYLNAEIRLLTQ